MSLVWLLVIVASVGGLVVVIGSRLPKTHIAASRIGLQTPADEVWRLITDFDAYPRWRPGLREVQAGPEIDGLPSWYEVCGRDIRVHFRVVASDPPRRLVTSLAGSGLPLAGTWVYELRPVDGGTELTITEQDKIYSPLFRFFTKLVLPYHAIMDVFLIALAKTLDQDVMPEHLSLRHEPLRDET